ncbi:MAG: anti-sigma factor antagonist [Bacillota bacterium]|nr:anti-sigma factor antagonist [Bacillota bacterium]
MNIKIDIEEYNESLEIKVEGEIDAYTAPKLRDAIFPLSEKENVKMTIDLSDVLYMDSTGLGVIVGVFKSVRSHNGDFKLIGLSDRLKRLFEITGLADIIDINSQIEGGVQ